jgi:hypothetical protein
MNRIVSLKIAAASAFALAALVAGDNVSAPGAYSLVSQANAVIGRPLTPMSYAGVARRTTRRAYAVGAGAAVYGAPVVVAPAPVVVAPACVQVVDAYGRIVMRCR